MKFQLRGKTYVIKITIDEKPTSNYDRSVSIWHNKKLVSGYRIKSSDVKEMIISEAKESVINYLDQQPFIVL